MEYGAIDLHKKESQVRIMTEGGEVIDRRIPTTRDHLTTLFWGRPHARILIEASTESEWVAQHLETLEHEVVVADPNYGLMYGHRSRRVKTDRRDVTALAEACRHGIYRPAHRRLTSTIFCSDAIMARDRSLRALVRPVESRSRPRSQWRQATPSTPGIEESRKPG